jgi:hypothetical protein
MRKLKEAAIYGITVGALTAIIVAYIILRLNY